MAGIRQINDHLWEASIELHPGIPLNVYLVRGKRFAIWVDSGMRAMFPILQETMERAGIAPKTLRFVLHTHPHAHHIGCDGQLQQFTGSLIAAQSRYAHWHTDYERHYQEYARAFPDLIPDTPELRQPVFDTLDEEHPVDLLINETVQFDLGKVFLSGYRFSGHMQSELAWFERQSRTFIFGDVLPLLDTPMMHGHLSVSGFRDTLERIPALFEELSVEQVVFSHYAPKTPEATLELVERTWTYLERLDTIVLNLIVGHGEISLEELWGKVSKTMDRRKDFRSLTTVYAHVQQFIRAGKVREIKDKVYCPEDF